jgi:hypothetical protein
MRSASFSSPVYVAAAAAFLALAYVYVNVVAVSGERTIKPWARHSIGDGTEIGADGARLRDANGDGLLDIVSGMEEGGVTKLYFNPGPSRSAAPWPSVTLSPSVSVEDALIADIDNDGNADIVSLTEGNDKSLLIFFGPEVGRQADASAWSRVDMSKVAGLPHMRFMFAVATDLNGDGLPEIIVGGKNRAQLGYLIAAKGDRRDPANWQFYPLRDIGWTMSLILKDMDGDGDLDLLFSDRRKWDSTTDLRGVYWLENPGTVAIADDPQMAWVQHTVGMVEEEAMFIDVDDIDGDGFLDVVVANKSTVEPAIFFGRDDTGKRFVKVTPSIRGLAAVFGTGKAVTIADIDGDGKKDIVYSAERAVGAKSGLVLLSFDTSPRNPADWYFSNIGGPDGIKFDLVSVLDVDDDGDLDIITTEEKAGGGGYGVIWYENPLNDTAG